MINSFVYLWTNKTKGRKYVGYHKGTLDDGYISSTSNDNFWKDFETDQFEREILFEGTRDECLKYEQDYLKCINISSDEWYNNARGAEIIFTQEVRDKIRNHHLGGTSGMLGKNHSEETCIKLSKRLLDTISNKIYKNASEVAKDFGYSSRTFVYTNIKSGRFIYIDNNNKSLSENHLKNLRKPNKNPGKKRSQEFKKAMIERVSNNTIYKFYNIHTKEMFIGTHKQFSNQFGIARFNVNSLIHRKTKILGGTWILENS